MAGARGKTFRVAIGFFEFACYLTLEIRILGINHLNPADDHTSSRFNSPFSIPSSSPEAKT